MLTIRSRKDTNDELVIDVRPSRMSARVEVRNKDQSGEVTSGAIELTADQLRMAAAALKEAATILEELRFG